MNNSGQIAVFVGLLLISKARARPSAPWVPSRVEEFLMRYRIVCMILGLALAGPVSVQAATTPARMSKAEQQVTAVLQTWVNAEIHRDAATLRRILSPKFITTYAAGTPHTRDDFIKAIVSGETTMTAHTLDDTKIVVDRDTAIAVGLDTIHGESQGKPFTGVYRYTITFVRRQARWVALAEHIVHVPDAK